MTSGNDFPHDEPAQRVLLAAKLAPHRSLNRTGFVVLMVALCAVSFAAGIVFLLMGAWPVVGFLGLDVLAISWAFRVNFTRARAFEEVHVSYAECRVRRVGHRGDVVEWTFNPLWVRIEREVHEEFGFERLYLVARGHRIGLGRFLGPAEKESFYNVLMPALREACRGPTYNPVA
ncbi:MAG: DUF2244 domain-containing protein [Xanthobacteraceae bacterium]|nr:DUF2244 domain-containing protein [Xanthobacteraceae bacterium]